MPTAPEAAAERPADCRQLGETNLNVSAVALGCWPIAGVTSLDVNDADSLATLRAARGCGVNFLDTAYCYGPNGESEKLIRRAMDDARESLVIATKGGIHYNDAGEQTQDARPETLRRECDESLVRLGVEQVELYYLHSPDPAVPIAESAGAIRDLVAAGKAQAAGASNCTLEQIQEFHAVCPLSAVQLPSNMLQRNIEEQTLPWCREQGVSVVVYWALMKGLLAGRLGSEKKLDENDPRRKYPMYQGEEWEKNRALVEQLREIADDADKTVAQLVVNWTMHQAGIAAVLCGAKRAVQIEETAGAMGWQLTDAQLAAIETAIVARGDAAAKRVFK